MSEEPDAELGAASGSQNEPAPVSKPTSDPEAHLAAPDATGPIDATEPQPDQGGRTTVSRRARMWALAGAGVAVLIVLLALAINVLGIGKGGGQTAESSASPSASPSPQFGPQQVDTVTLVARSAELGHPVYWAGKPGDRQLELTIAADDGTLVRYLEPEGGTGPGDALTVAMYPLADPYGSARSAAAGEGAMSQTVAGSLIVGNTANPYNGYLAREGLGYLVEVFDPTPGRAWKLLSQGDVVPVPAPKS